jgi:hypothetical protein
MEYAILYKDISATYNDVALALKQLGFQDASTSEHFRFVNEKHNSEIKLPAQPLETPFYKANLIGYSYIFYMQGIIKHRDDFAKRIEKNKQKASKFVKEAA